MPSLEGIPRLQLVPTGRVLFHEHPERNRTLRLVARLREEGVLRNPPIVAQLNAEDFVLLDGANRISALQEMDYSHLPVQVIDYGRPEVRLKGWHHLLLEGGELDLRGGYERLPGVRIERVEDSELPALLGLRRLYAVLVDPEGAAWGLFPESGRVLIRDWMAAIERVVAAYEGRTRLERIKLADYADLPDVFQRVDHQIALYPEITKVELLSLVTDGLRIPTGLTRHLIPGRALGLNLPLGFLADLETETDKHEYLRRFVDDLEIRGRIRFYEESAFIMNE